ncbi:BrxA family protein [Photobacterium phosphoreum]|uniref:BrxA family protein n=1 Tax=Photobacterium phosphoreum TaxID=659 RepID=UPI0039AF970C
MAEQYYTTQLSTGLALNDEMKLILNVWQPGMSNQDLIKECLQSGVFSNITATRLRNMLSGCFTPRFLHYEKAAENAKYVIDKLPINDVCLILYIYTLRANFILRQFLIQVYWQRYSSGYNFILVEEAKSFINQGLQEGMMKKPWSETTIKRNASYLIGCLVDYGFLEVVNRTERKLTPPSLSNNVIVYLAYELHFSGLGDNAIINHPDWQLFGLEPSDVREELKALSVNRHWIFQAAGSVVQISWAYNNMEEVIDVIS